MADTAEPTPGRPRKELRGEIVEVLENTNSRVMTLGAITDNVDGARRTVKDRLDKLEDSGPVQSEKVGNATAYWIPENTQTTTGPASTYNPTGGAQMGILTVLAWGSSILVLVSIALLFLADLVMGIGIVLGAGAIGAVFGVGVKALYDRYNTPKIESLA